jgi:hypothetical protein
MGGQEWTSPMIDVEVRRVPLLEDLLDEGPADVVKSESLARDLLRSQGVVVKEITAAIRALCLVVFRYRGEDEQGELAGWVIGGTVPHLILDSSEITNAFEALVIYAWYVKDWGDSKVPVEAKPDYRVPPDWNAIEGSWDNFKKYRMGELRHLIGLQIIQEHPDEIKHEDLRRMCYTHSWILQPWQQPKRDQDLR